MSAPDFAGARWRKSSRSNEKLACVEVASTQGVAGVRDSKQEGQGPILAFAPQQWSQFVHTVKDGGLDQH